MTEESSNSELRNHTDINLAERNKLASTLNHESNRKHGFRYSVTDHFVVIYKNIQDIYKAFGAWIDADPNSLARLLEARLPKILSHFNLLEPKTIQVVNVRKSTLLNVFVAGEHLRPKKDSSTLSYNNVFFSKTKASEDSISLIEDKPSIYTTAIHESIGHGIVGTALMGSFENKARNIRFLEEGLASYATDIVNDRNSHQIMQRVIAHDAGWVFGKKGMSVSEDEIKHGFEKAGNFLFTGGIPLREFFKLKSAKFDASKTAGFEGGGLKKVITYYRGASFIKYLVDTFGISKFKSWVRDVSSDNFYNSLSLSFGVSVEELEKGWRDSVLIEDFTQNPFLKSYTEEGLRWIQTQCRKFCD